nr:hypothetical protein [Planomicrobium sp. Y74]
MEHAKGNSSSAAARNFSAIRDAVCMEHGLQRLHSNGHTPAAECEYYLALGDDIDILLDLIELSLRAVPQLSVQYDSSSKRQYGLSLNPEDAQKALNQRFRENGVGYEFTDGILIQKDSEILHEEVTKPALFLLQEQQFKGALEEFLQAHDHYRKGHYGDSILNAGKAFESTMKTIADKEAWGLTGRENASNLVALLITNGIIPDYLQTTLLALATLRNKVAGHGQGAEPVAVPEHLVNYALHLCGTNIVMLIEAYKEYSK